jgi:L-alanine-DL-glutamate epimerase-like enolase superfamily enzyme
MALLDAFGRAHGFDLWRFFGGAERELVTDITIVTGTADNAAAAARRAAQAGFEMLKVKVGGGSVAHDLERLRAIAAAAPQAALLLDANASFAADEAIELLQALGELAPRIALFEQPVAAGDHAGLRRVREHARVRVAADESARSAFDVAALAGVVDVVNIKLMKTGVAQAMDMISAARASGLRLMIGGMVESKLAMTVAACLAAGLGDFSFVDLDTPMFLKDAPFAGGFATHGPKLRLDVLGPGHGVGFEPVLR